MAVAPNGNVYVAERGTEYTGGQVQEFTPSGELVTHFGFNARGVAVAPNGNVYAVSSEQVSEYTASGTLVTSFSGEGENRLSRAEGVAIAPNGNVYVVNSTQNATRVEEFSSSGAYLTRFGGEGTENGRFKEPVGVAISPNGNVYVADTGNNRVQEFSSSGTYLAKFGSEGTGNGQLKEPDGVTIAPNGNVYVADTGNSRVQEFTGSGEYVAQFGDFGTGSWQADRATGVAAAAYGYTTNGSVYVADESNGRVQKWVPASENPRSTQTVYYTAEVNPFVSACGGHPEWANLVCQARPAAQPETGPKLTVTTYTYNMWDSPETITEEIGTSTHKKMETYDAADRLLESEKTSGRGVEVQYVAYEYGSEIGSVVKQTGTDELRSKRKTITSAYNTLGQLTSYTDADGGVTKYTYDIDGRTHEVSVQETGERKHTQTYSYNPTTGALTELVDSAAKTFTATYDVEGKMLTESYPNGMNATYTYNAVGQATGLEYVKTTHCVEEAEKCKWFKNAIVPSAHGETLSQTSTLANESYTYDAAGRLIEAQETPTGESCKTRHYSYDEDSNRTTLTSQIGKSCATGGETVESHVYDSADRLIDPGVEYSTEGDITKLPASDAGGNELTSSYYQNNQLYTQEQNGEKISYYMDPSARVRETVSYGKTSSTVISHYAGPGEAAAWTSETSEKWTRNIGGIDGALDAIQTNNETPVIQIHDLQGNIVATAQDLSETETTLLTKYNSTEFGVPTTSNPPKYSWLGAAGVAAELPSGVIAQGGSSYVPELGRQLQTEGLTPVGDENGTFTGAPYTTPIPVAAIASANEWAGGVVQSYLAAQAAKAQQEEEERERAGTPVGNVPGPEGGGDPCTTSFAQGHVSLLGKQFISAWTTISWCYNGHEVFNAHLKNHGVHVHNHWWWPEEFEFVRWINRAEWLSYRVGEIWFIERTAEFNAEVPNAPIPSEFEGGVNPHTIWYIHLVFELFPNGEARAFSTVSCEPMC